MSNENSCEGRQKGLYLSFGDQFVALTWITLIIKSECVIITFVQFPLHHLPKVFSAMIKCLGLLVQDLQCTIL